MINLMKPGAAAHSQSSHSVQSKRLSPRRPIATATVGPSRLPAQLNPVGRSPVARPSSKAATYAVQAPIHLRGGQQIRATINGTQHVAGSIDISSGAAGKAHITNLRVDQQHRRRGVASKLIEAAITSARRQGFKAATLEARPSDNGTSPQALVAMYRRQGFRSIGKSGRGNPLMERKL